MLKIAEPAIKKSPSSLADSGFRCRRHGKIVIQQVVGSNPMGGSNKAQYSTLFSSGKPDIFEESDRMVMFWCHGCTLPIALDSCSR